MEIDEFFNKKYIILNSPHRTGGTLLANLLLHYIGSNNLHKEVKLYSHMHDPFLHRIGKFDDGHMFSILRKPVDTISSLYLYTSHLPKKINEIGDRGFNEIIDKTFDIYIMHYLEFLKNPVCTMIIFENLINSPDEVVINIFKKMKIDIQFKEDCKKLIKDFVEGESVLDIPVHVRHYPVTDIESPEYSEYKAALKQYIEKYHLIKIANEVYENTLQQILQ